MFAIIATMDITGMRKNYSVRHVVLITVQLANQFQTAILAKRDISCNSMEKHVRKLISSAPLSLKITVEFHEKVKLITIAMNVQKMLTLMKNLANVSHVLLFLTVSVAQMDLNVKNAAQTTF